MSLFRILVLLLVSLAVPAYGLAGVRPARACPMEMGTAPAADRHDHASATGALEHGGVHEGCPHGMDCCLADAAAGHACKSGQNCHPAAVIAPVSEGDWDMPVASAALESLVGLGSDGHQPPALWRPPRIA